MTKTRIAIGGLFSRRPPRFVLKPTAWRGNGIAVTRSADGDGWTVTHQRSGYAVAACFTCLPRHAALTVASLVSKFGPWHTVSAPIDFTKAETRRFVAALYVIREMVGA